MTDPSLVKLWADVEGWLRTARDSLALFNSETEEPLVEFEHYLSHNELELALDTLFEAGERSQQSYRFWDAMCQAAAHMKLETRERQFAERWAASKGRGQSNDG